MKTLKKLIDNNTPFSVVQYFEWMKTSKKETQKVYELMFLGSDGKNIISITLKPSAVDFFKENLSKFELKQNTKDGRVYEFNNFKQSLPEDYTYSK